MPEKDTNVVRDKVAATVRLNSRMRGAGADALAAAVLDELGHVTYDPEADGLYVRFLPDPIAGGFSAGDSYCIDLAADGRVVGVEMIGVRAEAERIAQRHEDQNIGAITQ